MSRNKEGIEVLVDLFVGWNDAISSFKKFFILVFIILISMLIYFKVSIYRGENPTTLKNPEDLINTSLSENSLESIINSTENNNRVAIKVLKEIKSKKNCKEYDDCIYIDENYALYTNHNAQQVDFTYTIKHQLENTPQDMSILSGSAIFIWSKMHYRWDIYGTRLDEKGEASFKRKFKDIKN